jgi:hypothetical protein
MKGWMIGSLVGVLLLAGVARAEVRSDAHQEYAGEIWEFVQSESYNNWTVAAGKLEFDFAPPCDAGAKTYLNGVAAKNPSAPPYGSVVVTEHFADGQETPVAITICYRFKENYNSESNDFYWAHLLADGTVVKTVADKCPFSKRGFAAIVDDDRLWVFRTGTKELADFLRIGEPAKHVIQPAAGPAGMTIKSSDSETVAEYLTAKPGFVTKVEDGRLWVFVEGSDALAEFEASGEPAKHVIRPAAGPRGMTIKAADTQIIDAYLAAKPGFVTDVVDGRIWVFREGCEELDEYRANGEPAKHVICPSAGPGGMTLKAPDSETIAAYVSAAEGFETTIDEGRIWAFRAGTPDLKEFKKSGEPAKQVIRPAAGPMGMTVKAPDADTIDAYLRAVGS